MDQLLYEYRMIVSDGRMKTGENLTDQKKLPETPAWKLRWREQYPARSESKLLTTIYLEIWKFELHEKGEARYGGKLFNQDERQSKDPWKRWCQVRRQAV